MRTLAERFHGDERGLIGKVMLAWVVILLILGVIALDGGSVLLAKYRTADAAGNAASEAAYTYKQTKKIADACDMADSVVASEDPEARIPPSGCFVNIQDGSVTITVKKVANTLLFKRVDFLADLAKASATETAPAPI